mgnify:CR=1 FL=1
MKELQQLAASAMEELYEFRHGFHEKPYEYAQVIKFRMRGILYLTIRQIKLSVSISVHQWLNRFLCIRPVRFSRSSRASAASEGALHFVDSHLHAPFGLTGCGM